MFFEHLMELNRNKIKALFHRDAPNAYDMMHIAWQIIM